MSKVKIYSGFALSSLLILALIGGTIYSAIDGNPLAIAVALIIISIVGWQLIERYESARSAIAKVLLIAVSVVYGVVAILLLVIVAALPVFGIVQVNEGGDWRLSLFLIALGGCILLAAGRHIKKIIKRIKQEAADSRAEKEEALNISVQQTTGVPAPILVDSEPLTMEQKILRLRSLSKVIEEAKARTKQNES